MTIIDPSPNAKDYTINIEATFDGYNENRTRDAIKSKLVDSLPAIDSRSPNNQPPGRGAVVPALGRNLNLPLIDQ
jgi:hypothetical protein